MTGRYRQNKSPFAIALGDWFPLKTYFLTSKASPNDSQIVIVVIIIVIGEAKLMLHSDGIIAQTHLSSADSRKVFQNPHRVMTEKISVSFSLSKL
jgi:hypothetical protein